MGCKRQFSGGQRLDNELLWEQYRVGKQTYAQLAATFKCSIKTVQRRLDKIAVKAVSIEGRGVVVLMDTTYFGRALGVMLFKDALSGQNLLKYYVGSETNEHYRKGIETLLAKGFEIKAIVCDGRRGLLGSFGEVPMQMCGFHQVAILRRYLTNSPKSEAAIALKGVGSLLKQTDRESFQGALQAWHSTWESYLKERTVSPVTGKTTYTHKRLRSAYRSLKTNLPWLFTWYDHIELAIPTTTNALEGHFADLKTKLRVHNGLNLERKKRFIDAFLKA